mgnify:CR=1 FL=1
MTVALPLDRFEEFSPCQDGGIAAWLFEHGDSGCGDANWPKSILYVAGWGWGDATLNGAPLHSDYQIHFMVTQGMRDRETLDVRLREGVLGGRVAAIDEERLRGRNLRRRLAARRPSISGKRRK